MNENRRSEHRFLSIVKVVVTAAVIGFAATGAQAQAPAPPGTGDFAAEMARLVDQAADLVPLIREQVESPLLEQFETLSLWIAAIVMGFSFARVFRENDGASKDLYYWVGRLVICMILFGTGPTILNTMQKMGQAVVFSTPIKAAYDARVVAFEQNYEKFLRVGFTVESDEGPLGLLADNESPVTSINKALNPSSWNMPQVFTLVTVARGLMEFGDLFLLLLGQFVMIALRLTSPFVIALAIDQKLAHSVVYPYIKGAAAFTLIAPAVGAIVAFFAYAAANVPLTAIDFDNPIFQLDPDTLRIAGDPSRAVYPALIGAAIMLVSSLALFGSPYISYRIASGQVFEGISGVATGWMAALSGMAVEAAGVRHAAGLERQAQTVQAQGAYAGEMERARSSFDAANLGTQARKLSALAAARGALTATLGQIYGSRTQAIQQAQAGQLFGVTSAQATAALTKGDIGVRLGQSVGDLHAGRAKELGMIEANRSADTWRWWGDKTITGSKYFADSIRGATTGRDGRTGKVGTIGAGVVELGGGATGLYLQEQSIQRRAAGQSAAVNVTTDTVIANQERAATGLTSNQDSYLDAMTQTHQKYTQDQIAAVRAGSDQAAGGASQGASITMGGINTAAALEARANRTMFDGASSAAAQVRDSALVAARLHMSSAIVHQLSRAAARAMEGLALRY